MTVNMEVAAGKVARVPVVAPGPPSTFPYNARRRQRQLMTRSWGAV